MALQMARAYPSGLSLEQSYIKVKSIKLDVSSKTVYIDLAVYVDKQARDDGLQPVEVSTHAIYSDEFGNYFTVSEMDKSAINVIKQCYRALKTKPEYVQAIDV